jgi:hypothetical protein
MKIRFFAFYLLFCGIANAQKPIEIKTIIDSVDLNLDSTTIIKKLNQFSKKVIKKNGKAIFSEIGLTLDFEYYPQKLTFKPNKNLRINGQPFDSYSGLDKIKDYFKLGEGGRFIYGAKYDTLELSGNTERKPNDIVSVVFIHEKQNTNDIILNQIVPKLPAWIDKKKMVIHQIIAFPEFPPPPPPDLFPYIVEVNHLTGAVYTFIKNKEYENALKMVNEISDKYPEEGPTLRMKGFLLTKLYKYKAAVESNQKLIKTSNVSEGDYLNLQELSLLTNQYQVAADIKKQYYKKIISTEYRLLATLHDYIAKYLLGQPTGNSLANIHEAINYLNFKNFNWSFGLLKNWLANEPSITATQKSHILGEIERVEKANYTRY